MNAAAPLSAHSAQVCRLPRVVWTVACGDRTNGRCVDNEHGAQKGIEAGATCRSSGGRLRITKNKVNSKRLVVFTGVVSRPRRGETLELVLK